MRKTETGQQLKGDALARLGLPILVLVLLFSVITCAVFAEMDTARHGEFAQAADPFGYLQMAQDMRRGEAPHGLPRFTVDSEHLRIYLAFLKAHGWNMEGEYGPGVYHFAAGTGRIISPYPPGVGVTLSVFAAGRAVFTWQMITAGALVLLAAGACGWMLRKKTGRAALAAALFCLLAVFGLLTLGLAVSFSVDLSWLPLLVAVSAGFLGRGKSGWAGRLLLALAGAALGWAAVVRLANGVFLIGFLALCLGGGWKKSGLRAAAFLAGFAAAGIIPLMIYDAAMTGSAFHSTYLAKDAAGLSLRVMGTNADYYFAGGGSGMLWIFASGAAGFIFWEVGRWSLRGRRSAGGENGRHALMAIALWWATPTAYFLVHRIFTPYYQFPTMFVCLAGMAWTVFCAPEPGGPEKAAAKWWPVVAIAPVAGMVLFLAVRLPPLSDPALMAVPDLTLPAELDDPKAWIIADRLGGTLWYYDGIATQSVVGLDPETRREFFAFLRSRGEPVYLLVDNPAMAGVAGELKKDGAKLIAAGQFARRVGAAGRPSAFTEVCRVEWKN